MKIKILKNEALIGNVSRNTNVNHVLYLTTTFQEYFKTGKEKGKPQEVSKRFFFAGTDKLNEAIKMLESKFNYKIFETFTSYASEKAEVNDNWEEGLYFNLLPTRDFI